MSRRDASAQSRLGRQARQLRPGPGAGWTAALGALGVVLAAVAAVLDRRESLQWLWFVLIVAGALVAVPATVLASPWWQQRQAARAADAERAHRVEESRLPGPRQGQYFTGRTRALRDLVSWLAAPLSPDRPILVVTSAPGSGKSAVLDRLVTLADPRGRDMVRADPGVDPASVPPAGSIDVSVRAEGKSRSEIVEHLIVAAGIQAATEGELVRALERSERPLTVVVDALDEATGAEEVAGLLVRLVGTGGMRLLVGTRWDLVDRLVDPDQALDLDSSTYQGESK